MDQEKQQSVDVTGAPQVDVCIPEEYAVDDVEVVSTDVSEDTVGTDLTTQSNVETSKSKSKPKHKKNSVDDTVIPKTSTDDLLAIDKASRSQNAIDSDRDYRRITEKIIDETCVQLTQHTGAKEPLRTKLSSFIITILSVQFAVLVAILFLNRQWNLQISDFILNVYIVSVFVETLAGLIIMINFAFNSQQEVELIKILNAIIINFKKYEEK